MIIRKLPLWIVMLCAGCGHSGQFSVSQGPNRSFREFSQLEVRAFSVEGAHYPGNDPDEKKGMQEIPSTLRALLVKRFAKKEMFQGMNGEKFVISGRIMEYDPGDRTARWLVGFGAGAGKIVADVSFSDAQGNPIARGTATGNVAGGFAGGSIDGVVDDLADLIVQFTKDNLKKQEK